MFTPFLGDYQFDVYRMMRKHVGKSWETYRPLTNVMVRNIVSQTRDTKLTLRFVQWLHYLVDKLLNEKQLRAPIVPRKITVSSTYTERECYECLVEVEGVLRAAVSSYNPATSKRGRRKTQAVAKSSDTAGPRTAADVLDYGIERGWVLASVS